ncbi:MAG: response regulator [Candidatus Hodarchaeales archaeon]
MTKIILLVEDNLEILNTTQMLLELNGYNVLTATNGKKALQILADDKRIPDLVISDIMMPKMDGYTLFQKLSENPSFHHIPFIFLTAKASNEDIQLGKRLGVDDYITKPFSEENLLASVEGKIRRINKIENIRKHLENRLLSIFKIKDKKLVKKIDENDIWLINIIWDETQGPKLDFVYPEEVIPNDELTQIGSQLFQTTVSIYGLETTQEPEGILLRISNLQRDGYLYFDALSDDEVRGGQRQFMLAVLAPSINYLESLELKDILSDIALNLKEKKKINAKKSWEKIVNVLTSPVHLENEFKTVFD